MDLHAAQIQGFFRIPVDHLIAAPIMAEYYHKQALGPDVTVVSPDIGGTARARSFSDRMGAPLAIIDKRRPEPNVSEVMNIIGAVKGRKCIMVDDLADTAGTLAKGAVALMEAGAVSVSACATHGVLSNGAQDKINDSVLTELVVTDTIPGHIQSDKMRTLTVAGLFARAIWAIHEELSVASLFK
jgi:ribose-phosphate pyrophosphokinase